MRITKLILHCSYEDCRRSLYITWHTNAQQVSTLIVAIEKIFMEYIMLKKYYLLFFLPETLGSWLTTLSVLCRRYARFMIRLTLPLETRDGCFPQQATRNQQKRRFYINETSTAWKALKPYFSSHCHHVKSQAVLSIIKQNFCIQHHNLMFHNQGKIITFHHGCSLMTENGNALSMLSKPLYYTALRTSEYSVGIRN